MDHEQNFYDRKLEHIRKDYDSAMSALLKTTDCATNLRHWNIMVSPAYLGWVVQSGRHIALWPLALALYGFWMLDGLISATQRFRSQFTVAQAEQLFSRRTLHGVRQSIERYKFLTDTKGCTGKQWWPTGGKIHRLLGGLINEYTTILYILPLLFLFLCDRQLRPWFPIVLNFVGVLAISLHWYNKLERRRGAQQRSDDNYSWKEEEEKSTSKL